MELNVKDNHSCDELRAWTIDKDRNNLHTIARRKRNNNLGAQLLVIISRIWQRLNF
jgi:hypothetical protein